MYVTSQFARFKKQTKKQLVNIDNAGACQRRSRKEEIATLAPYIETGNPPRAHNLVLAPHSASPAPQIELCHWWEIDDTGKIQFSTNERVAGDIGAPPGFAMPEKGKLQCYMSYATGELRTNAKVVIGYRCLLDPVETVWVGMGRSSS